MRKRWYVVTALGLLAAAVSAGLAVASGQGGPIVRTPETILFVPNALSGTTMHFEPGAVSVKSGGSITFIDVEMDEPHTVTVINQSEEPRTAAQVNNCKGCALALAHLKDPKHPDSSPIKTYVVNKGQPGFDTRGDSLFLAPGGPHKHATVVVSAPAGTTLYYVCAVHPWMQGSINVT